MLVGLLKVCWRTCCGSSLLPPRRRRRTAVRGERECSCDQGSNPGHVVPLSSGAAGYRKAFSATLRSGRPILIRMEGRRACPELRRREPRAGAASACPAAPRSSGAARAARPRSRAGAKFCIECGAGSQPAPPPQRPPRPAAPAERAARGAPPGLRPVRRPLRLHRGRRADGPGGGEVDARPHAARLGEQVERFGGSIDKYIGDNVMAVFGAPVAHEDDPERAVRAGLAMQAAMEDANRRAARPASPSRCGSGSTPARCWRAPGRRLHRDRRHRQRRRPPAGGGRPGQVTVGESTYRASREAIAYEQLEPLDAEGQGGAGPGLGGDAGGRRARARAPRRAEAPLIGRERGADCCSRWSSGVEREERAAPGHRARPGRGRASRACCAS